MFCNQCGCELPDNSRFCLKCGTRLPEPGAYSAPAQQPQAQPAPVGSASEPPAFTLQAYVDEAQIREEALVEISDPRLPCPARVQLRRSMKEGEVLTVTSERSAGSFAPFRLVLHVAAESFELHRTVTEEQLRRGEILEVQDPRLARPARVQLDPGMRDGDRKLIRPGAGKSDFSPFWLVIHVAAQQTQSARQPDPTQHTSQPLIDFTVYAGQIRRHETITVRDCRLPRAVEVVLRDDMGNGDLIRITPGKDSKQFDPFLLRLHVIPDQQQTYTAPQQQTYTAPQQPAYTAPQPQRTAPAPQAPGASAAALSTCRCNFRLEKPEKLNGYRFGGDDGGNVDVYADRLELFKKSAGVAVAFGVIGSAIEGKGKLFFVLRPEMVLRGEKRPDKAGRPEQFIFYLQDGRGLRLNLTGDKAAGPAIARVFRV